MVFGTRLAGGDLNADGYGDIAVSAPGYNNFQGQVRIYYGSATGLPALADLTLFGDANASTCQNGERFGMSLAIADFHHDGNEDLAVGADWFGDCRGRVYLFLGAPSPAGVSSTPAMQLLGQQDAAWFGNAISNAGDVNGDGYADLIVGSPMHTNGVGHASEGLVSLFSGSISGLNTSPSWTYENDQNASNLGLAVSTAGDLDADGYSDVVCGAPFYDGTETDEGRAYAFLGSASGLSDYPAWLSDGDQASAHYGTAVSFLKDTIVGSDEVSFGAILVGAPDFNSAVDTSPFEEGRAFAYAGNAQGVSFSLPEQFRVSGGTLPLGETSDFNGGFRAGMQADNDFAGMAWAKPCLPMSWMEWEVARLGGTFDGNPDDQTDGQSVSGDPVTFMPLILGLEPGTPYIWRARISTNYALFPNTPWLTVQGRPPKELKFFTPDGGGSTRPSGPP
jgi:hypothetical protein